MARSVGRRAHGHHVLSLTVAGCLQRSLRDLGGRGVYDSILEDAGSSRENEGTNLCRSEKLFEAPNFPQCHEVTVIHMGTGHPSAF
jgi:hypothetical protein